MRPLNSSKKSAICALIAILFAACKGNDRAEASSVMRALEVVREAPKDQKQGPADTLAKVPCTNSVVCDARDRCAEVYRHFARGMEEQRRVMAELEKLEQDPPQTTEKIGELSGELDHAEKEINGAEAGLAGCEEAASLMRRTFGI